MSESEEAKLHDEVILMWARNIGKPYIIKRIMKRMYRCLLGALIIRDNNERQ